MKERVTTPNRCFLCGLEKETIHHIMLHCSVVKLLWEIVFTLLSIRWVFPKTIKEVLVNFFYRQKEEKDLLVNSFVHNLDNMEREKPYNL